MKKKKIIVLFLFIFAIAFTMPTHDVYAKACSSYTKKSKCNKHSQCTWDKKTKTCGDKTDGGASTTDVSNKNLTFCKRTAKIWKIVGRLFIIIKIVVPLILIIMGSIDFGKAVVSSKEDEIKKSAKTFALRAASGIIIFFVPTIVTIIMGLITSFTSSGAKADYEVCRTCIMKPNECNTSNDASN